MNFSLGSLNLSSKPLKAQVLILSKLAALLALLIYLGGYVASLAADIHLKAPDIEVVLMWTGLIAAIITFSYFLTLVIPPVFDFLIRKASQSIDYDKYNSTYHKILIATVVATLLSAITTAAGLKMMLIDDNSTIEKKLIFYVLVVALPVFLSFLWIVIIQDAITAPKKSTFLKKFITPFIVASVVVLTFFASTSTSSMGIGGTIVMQSHLVYSVEKLNDRLNDALEFRMAENALFNTANQHQEYWDNIAEEEAKTGKYTGSPGKGALYKYLKGLAATFGQISKGIQKGDIDNLQANVQNISLEIESLRNKLMETQEDELFANQREYIEEVKTLYQKVNSLVDNNKLISISSFIEDFDIYNPKTATSNKSPRRIIKKQDNMMNIFGANINKSKEDLSTSLAKAKSLKPERISFDYINIFEAIFTYAVDIKVFWAICIILDIVPLICYLFIVKIGAGFILKETEESDDNTGSESKPVTV